MLTATWNQKNKFTCSIVTLLPLLTPPSSPNAQKFVQANLKPTRTLTDKGKLTYPLKWVQFLPNKNQILSKKGFFFRMMKLEMILVTLTSAININQPPTISLKLVRSKYNNSIDSLFLFGNHHFFSTTEIIPNHWNAVRNCTNIASGYFTKFLTHISGVADYFKRL